MGEMYVAKEAQYRVDPEDIKACSLRCTKCESEITSAIDAAYPWLESCPMCLATWHRDSQVDKAKYFVALLRELRQESKSPVRMRLVLDVDAD